MTRTEHGIRPHLPRETAKLEAAYAAHRGMALVASRCCNREMARWHARRTQALVAEHARVAPFSPESGRLYLRGGL